jgi:hypothetical protein
MRPSAVPWGRRLARMKQIISLVRARMDGHDAVKPGPARFSFPRLVPANATSPAFDVVDERGRVTPAGLARTDPAGVRFWFRRFHGFFRREIFGKPESVHGTAKSAADMDFEIAIHESSHAICCRILNDCVSLVSIVEDAQLGRAGVTISGNGGWTDLAMNRSVSDNFARVDKMASIIDRNKPRDGESRDISEPWLAAVHSAVVKLMAGVAGELLIFGKSNDRRASGDYAEALRLSLTIATNSSAAQAFLEFAAIEAREMLRPHSLVVRALADELVARRELSGAEVDEVIAAAIAAKSIEDECQRRADWNGVIQRAAGFEKDQMQ